MTCRGMNSAMVSATTSASPVMSATTRRACSLVRPPTSAPRPYWISAASMVSTSMDRDLGDAGAAEPPNQRGAVGAQLLWRDDGQSPLVGQAVHGRHRGVSGVTCGVSTCGVSTCVVDRTECDPQSISVDRRPARGPRPGPSARNPNCRWGRRTRSHHRPAGGQHDQRDQRERCYGTGLAAARRAALSAVSWVLWARRLRLSLRRLWL